MTGTMWESFDLPPGDARRLMLRQATWTLAQAGAMGALSWTSASPDVVIAVATALGAAASRPAKSHLLPLVVVFVVAATLLLAGLGMNPALAAGAMAGLAVGHGSALARVEAVLAGVAGAGLGLWVASALQLPTAGMFTAALWTGTVVGLCVSQALLPGALRWHQGDRIPSPGRIQAVLQAEFRASAMRAWQLDQELAAQAPDRDTRRGLSEVAAWVYRLGVTLQTLDGDLARIDPEAVRARRDELLAPAAAPGGEDAFIHDRRVGTAQHLSRMLEHRDALALERARSASLQDYALAYLEEARAGLAVARVHAGERTPESLGVVLQKLRDHANESGARRRTALEINGIAGG